jgi:hypothetical protein
MQVNSSQREYAIFRALLTDEHALARAELLRSGVSERQITNLYPYDLAALNDGVEAYMRSGKRITLRHAKEVHQSLVRKSTSLYVLFPHSHTVKNREAFENQSAANAETAQAIIKYHAATFSEVEGFTSFSGAPAEQAQSLLARLNVALLYAQHLSPDSEAGAYLGELVDTYLPDLLRVKV